MNQGTRNFQNWSTERKNDNRKSEQRLNGLLTNNKLSSTHVIEVVDGEEDKA